MPFMLFTVFSFLHINLKLQRFVPERRPSVDVQSCLVVRVEGTDYFRKPGEESAFSLFLLPASQCCNFVREIPCIIVAVIFGHNVISFGCERI